MNRTLTRRVVIGAVLAMAGCHAHAYYYEPALPPPPPPGPPPGAPAPLSEESMQSAPPAPTPAAEVERPQASASEIVGDAGATPLPALPSQAPRYAPAAPPVAAPSTSEWVRSYPEGQWVYHASYGWIWVPADAGVTGIDGVPYTYLYTPRFGWTWYVSPWGWGHYHFGPWVSHPVRWHHAWVAHPHIVIRLGRPRPRH